MIQPECSGYFMEEFQKAVGIEAGNLKLSTK